MALELSPHVNDAIVQHNLSKGEARVLHSLADHLNKKTLLCCPSLARIASETGLCVRQVQRAVAKLCKLCLIWFTARHRRSSLFHFLIGPKELRRERSSLTENVAEASENVRQDVSKMSALTRKGFNQEHNQKRDNTTHPSDETRGVPDEGIDQIEIGQSSDEQTTKSIAFTADGDMAHQDISNRVPDDVPDQPEPQPSVWREGMSAGRKVPYLAEMPEQRIRALLGKWTKMAGGDMHRVVCVLRSAANEQPVDPIGWITAALKGRQNNRPGSVKRGGMSLLLAARNTALEQGDAFGCRPHVAAALAAWNDAAAANDWPQASITPDRDARLVEVLHEIGGLDAWRTALATLPTSSNLYRGDSGWVPTLDWMLKPCKAIQLVEEAEADARRGGKRAIPETTKRGHAYNAAQEMIIKAEGVPEWFADTSEPEMIEVTARATNPAPHPAEVPVEGMRGFGNILGSLFGNRGIALSMR